MEIKEAVEAAEKDLDVQAHASKGFYLSSALAIPETLNEITQWTLVYFHPEDQKVFSVEVTKSSVTKGEASTPLVEDHYSRLGYETALSSKELLGILTEAIAKEKEFPTRVIITLREGEWKIAVVTKSLRLLRIDLDAETGEVKNIDKSNLVKPV